MGVIQMSNIEEVKTIIQLTLLIYTQILIKYINTPILKTITMLKMPR